MKIHVVIEKGKSPDQEKYSCYCPDVLGCITTADTIETALLNIVEALELYFEGEDLESLGLNFRSAAEVAKTINFDSGDLLACVDVNLVSNGIAA